MALRPALSRGCSRTPPATWKAAAGPGEYHSRALGVLVGTLCSRPTCPASPVGGKSQLRSRLFWHPLHPGNRYPACKHTFWLPELVGVGAPRCGRPTSPRTGAHVCGPLGESVRSPPRLVECKAVWSRSHFLSLYCTSKHGCC